MSTITSDARDFAEGFIYDHLRPVISKSVEIYRGSRPKEEDPDFYISILTEDEAEVQPGSGVWILQQTVVLVCSIGEREATDHVRYRSQVRQALMTLTGITNVTQDLKGRWYGTFITSITNANKRAHYGDIFYLETRARAIISS
jgi:hypothetical protein